MHHELPGPGAVRITRKIALVLLSLALGFTHRGTAQLAGDSSVLVEGRAVRVRLLGAGSPPVILVSGQCNALNVWFRVQPAIGERTRVLAYDRPGLGQSDPGAEPRTVGRMADELHALLAELRLAPPYVLCGHSLGGFVVELYAARFPGEVAGLVLVDPSVEEFYVRADSLPEYRAIMTRAEQEMAQAPPGARAEWAAFEASREAMRHAGPLPAVPIRMLISVHHGNGSPAIEETWRDTHVAWANAHAGGQYVIDETSGHHIQLNNPALVLQTVDTVVQEVRRRGRRQ